MICVDTWNFCYEKSVVSFVVNKITNNEDTSKVDFQENGRHYSWTIRFRANEGLYFFTQNSTRSHILA